MTTKIEDYTDKHGVVYEAIPCEITSCNGCVFRGDGVSCIAAPDCTTATTIFGCRDMIIWVKKNIIT